jgi:hypothetical protein|tara:strand:- start:1098 stop:1280 length:183 start_codon:yes stop_codon:yes gene_type:complete
MDDIDLAHRIKRTIDERKSLIEETLMGGRLTDMEMYKSIQGELSALSLIEEQISDYFREK